MHVDARSLELRSAREIAANARAVYRRLRLPINAVIDRGIDLKRPIPPPNKPAPAAEQVWRSDLEQHNEQLRALFLRTDAPPAAPALATLTEIDREICRAFDIRLVELRSRRRSTVLARQIAAALARYLTAHSLPQIGRHFGYCDHTTVLHAARKLAPAIAKAADTLPDGASVANWIRAVRGALAQ